MGRFTFQILNKQEIVVRRVVLQEAFATELYHGSTSAVGDVANASNSGVYHGCAAGS